MSQTGTEDVKREGVVRDVPEAVPDVDADRRVPCLVDREIPGVALTCPGAPPLMF